MPWKIQEKNGKFCVIKESDGSTVACHPSKEKAQAQMKALYASEGEMKKLEEAQGRVLLEGVGPALVAAAVTAKPHLRQRGKEIRMVTRDGKELVEVPLLKKGIYRHPKGNLVFNDAFVNRMIENHRNKVTDYNVHLDFRHDDKQGSLAFLDPDDGGWLELGQDDWLYAYGPPADAAAKDIIKSRKWRFSSPEFAPNYESNFVQKLSAEDMEFISMEDLVPVEEPKVVSSFNLSAQKVEAPFNQSKKLEVVMNILEDGTATLSAEEVVQVQGLLDKVTKLEAEVARLTPAPEPTLPEAVRVRLEALEAENKAVKEQQLREKVAFALEKARAYRDENGRGHSTIFLNLVKSGLMLEEAKIDDATVIKLEAETEEGKVRYYKNLLSKMLEVVPGQVPMEGKTLGEETRLESSYGHYTEDDLKLEIESFSKY